MNIFKEQSRKLRIIRMRHNNHLAGITNQEALSQMAPGVAFILTFYRGVANLTPMNNRNNSHAFAGTINISKVMSCEL